MRLRISIFQRVFLLQHGKSLEDGVSGNDADKRGNVAPGYENLVLETRVTNDDLWRTGIGPPTLQSSCPPCCGGNSTSVLTGRFA